MTATQAPTRLAITMGDPAGIGPEIIVKAAHALRERIEGGASLPPRKVILSPEILDPRA